jgi:hypothetical protein
LVIPSVLIYEFDGNWARLSANSAVVAPQAMAIVAAAALGGKGRGPGKLMLAQGLAFTAH